MKYHVDYRATRYLDVFPIGVAPKEEGQINISVVRPGTTVAFHRHQKQVDYWLVVKGELEVCIYEPYPLASDISDISGNTIFLIAKNGRFYYENIPDSFEGPLGIQPGVWHGYKNIGVEDAVLIYYTTKKYDKNNPDEERITPKKLGIHFPKEVK